MDGHDATADNIVIALLTAAFVAAMFAVYKSVVYFRGVILFYAQTALAIVVLNIIELWFPWQKVPQRLLLTIWTTAAAFWAHPELELEPEPEPIIISSPWWTKLPW